MDTPPPPPDAKLQLVILHDTFLANNPAPASTQHRHDSGMHFPLGRALAYESEVLPLKPSTETELSLRAETSDCGELEVVAKFSGFEAEEPAVSSSSAPRKRPPVVVVVSPRTDGPEPTGSSCAWIADIVTRQCGNKLVVTVFLRRADADVAAPTPGADEATRCDTAEGTLPLRIATREPALYL